MYLGYKEESPYKIVCYFGGWAIYRDEPMSFSPEDMDANMCTHFIYSFAGLDEDTFKIKSLDPKVDIEEGTKNGGKLVLF